MIRDLFIERCAGKQAIGNISFQSTKFTWNSHTVGIRVSFIKCLLAAVHQNILCETCIFHFNIVLSSRFSTGYFIHWEIRGTSWLSIIIERQLKFSQKWRKILTNFTQDVYVLKPTARKVLFWSGKWIYWRKNHDFVFTWNSPELYMLCIVVMPSLHDH